MAQRKTLKDALQENYPEYYGWFDYPADQAAVFCKTDAKWGIFGNFAQTPIQIDGVPFNCTEKIFQIMKFTDKASRKAIYSRNGQTIKMTAKHQEKVSGIRSDWAKIFVDAMKYCLVQKYQQSEAFRTELNRSKGLYIVEKQPSATKPANTWCAKLSSDGKTWSGPNLLGRLLMELRDTGTLAYTLPADATNFSDLKE